MIALGASRTPCTPRCTRREEQGTESDRDHEQADRLLVDFPDGPEQQPDAGEKDRGQRENDGL